MADEPPRRRSRLRGLLAVVGVVVSCALLVAAALGVWARRSFLKTDVFSDRAGGLIDDAGVQTALSAYLADQLNQLIDPQTILEDALPDQAQILIVPLAGAVEDFVGEQVDTFVRSEGFARLWKTSVEFAHRELVRVLEGDTPLVEESEDHIVINLLPVINSVLAQIGEVSPELFGRTVDLPTITVEDVPDAARDAIGNALGVTLDDDFGTFTVYDDGALSSAQAAVSLADRLVWLLIALVPLSIAATLAVAPRRRRTLLQLAVGIVVAMVLVRRLVFLFQKDLLELVQQERNVPAVDAVSDAFLDPLLDGALWLGIGALVIAALTWLTGPYAWARSLRGTTVSLTKAVTTTASDRSQDPATRDWVATNLDRLRLGGAAVGLVLLWWLDLSWLGFVALAVVVVAYELAVGRLGEAGTPTDVAA